MLVKCKGCSNKIDKDKAFKVVNGKVNSYYCSEKEYLSILKEKKFKEDSIEWIKSMCNLKNLGKHGTILFNKLNKKIVDKYGSSEVLLNTILSCREEVLEGFENNSIMIGDNRMRYQFTVLEKFIDKGVSMTAHNNKINRLNFKDYEQSITDIVYIKKENKKDISKLIKIMEGYDEV